MLNHTAAGSEVSFAESGVYRLQNGVAVGSIHQDFESSGERNGVTGPLEPEIRHTCVAVHIEGGKLAGHLSGGMQDPRNAVKYAQIGVVKHVLPGNRRIAWLVRVPGPKAPGRMDVSGRLSVRQPGVISHSDAGAGRIQPKAPDLLAKRRLPAVPRQDFHRRVANQDLLDNHRRLGRALGLDLWLRAPAGKCPTLVFGRDVDSYSVHGDQRNRLWRIKQRAQVDAKAQLPNPQDGGHVAPAVIPQREFLAIDLCYRTAPAHQQNPQRRDLWHSDMQRLKLHIAIEAPAQILNGLVVYVRLESLAENRRGNDQPCNGQHRGCRETYQPTLLPDRHAPPVCRYLQNTRSG